MAPVTTASSPPSALTIQFDEASLSRAKSSSHRQNPSAATAASRVTSDTPRISHAASSHSIASTMRQKKARPKVVTVPAWAPDEQRLMLGDDYEYVPHPGAASSGGLSEPRQRAMTSSTTCCAPPASPAAASNSTGIDDQQNNTSRSAPQTLRSTSFQDSNRTEDESPGRFWTFTLPAKYRKRLHEHHLRMLREKQEDERWRNQRRDDACSSGSDTASDDASDTDDEGARAKGRCGFLQGLGGAIPTSTDSHPHTADSRKRKEKLRERAPSQGQQRADAVGMGGASGVGIVAGFLGASDGVSSWRRRHQQQHLSPLQSPNPQASTSSHDEEKGMISGGGRAKATQNNAINGDDPSNINDSSRGDVETADPTLFLSAIEMRARIPGRSDDGHRRFLTRHQAQTPGWESPWRPEGGLWDWDDDEADGASFDDGTRCSRDAGIFPHSDSKTSKATTGKGKRQHRRRRRRNGQIGTRFDEKTGRIVSSGGSRTLWSAHFSHFVLHNPFAPLLLRIINICFTTATLAVAVRLWRVLHREDAAESVGASPIMGIIISPLSLVHVGGQVWLEYFGRPIGLWKVGSKLGYQLIELVFISLWSAELALTLDNYATSSLVCVKWYTSFYGTMTATGDGSFCSAVGADALSDPSLKLLLCRYQGVLIGLSFTTLVAYVLVFAVSLFRTVSRK